MIKTVSVSTMRQSDKATIEKHTDSKTLMLRAGRAIYESVDFSGRRVCILCGSGNNAGVGYVLAELLHREGIYAELCLIKEAFSPDGRHFFDIAVSAGVLWRIYDDSYDFGRFDIITDCVFGTGWRGELCEPYADIFRKVNDSRAFVVSADINSGLDGDSGLGDDCIKSDLTVSIGTYKSGHFLGRAKDVMKNKINCDIGIKICGEQYFVCEQGDFGDILSERENHSHKGSYGYCGILAGSREYSGAAKLANFAANFAANAASAMRSGCGVVTLAVPESICSSVSPYLLESTLFSLPEKDGKAVFDKDALDSFSAKLSALSCGMGWGESEEYEKILSYLIENVKIPIVIDADGINTLARMDKSILKTGGARLILTPHPLEFSRISGYSMQEILQNPIGCAKSFANEYGVILLLKGTSSVITDGKEVYIVDRGCAGMATAGSGDVLSGILTGLLGYNDATAKTVACGAYIAGLAGEYAGKKYGNISMIASDTVKEIPEAIKEMTKGVQK